MSLQTLLSNSLISNVIITDIPCEPQQQLLCETECGDNDEAHELGDQDGEGSATDEDSEPESENVGERMKLSKTKMTKNRLPR